MQSMRASGDLAERAVLVSTENRMDNHTRVGGLMTHLMVSEDSNLAMVTRIKANGCADCDQARAYSPGNSSKHNIRANLSRTCFTGRECLATPMVAALRASFSLMSGMALAE